MSVTESIKYNPYVISGSHAAGLDYVPYDGYIAELHKGEMVVPRSDAEIIREHGRQIEEFRRRQNGYTQMMSQIVAPNVITPELDVMASGRIESLLAALVNKDTDLYINGQRIATATARDADTVNGARIALTKRGVAL